MLYQSNQGYEEISANIINDLINGSYERGNPSLEERPSKEALAELPDPRARRPLRERLRPRHDELGRGERRPLLRQTDRPEQAAGDHL